MTTGGGPEPWESVCPLMVTQAVDINTDHSCSRTKDPDLVLSSIPGSDVTMALGSSEILIF